MLAWDIRSRSVPLLAASLAVVHILSSDHVLVAATSSLFVVEILRLQKTEEVIIVVYSTHVHDHSHCDLAVIVTPLDPERTNATGQVLRFTWRIHEHNACSIGGVIQPKSDAYSRSSYARDCER